MPMLDINHTLKKMSRVNEKIRDIFMSQGNPTTQSRRGSDLILVYHRFKNMSSNKFCYSYVKHYSVHKEK